MTINYTDLIHEAFVAPLRSATIIDDEYPTWNHWLSGHATIGDDGRILDPKGKYTWEKSESISKRIDELRKRNLIVDVHDGCTEGARIQNYHHSDLVVLDYQLDGQGSNGSKSMGIARRLLTENDHFNLIVLHTQQDDELLINPFMDLLTRLLKAPRPMPQKLVDEGEDLIEEHSISDKLVTAFGAQHYALISKHDWKFFIENLSDGKLAEIYPVFSELCQTVNNLGFDKAQLTRLTAAICHKQYRRFADNFSDSTADGLTWSMRDKLWIKTNRGFIAFSSKKKSETKLIEVLIEALSDWEPTPSRLISGKIRNLLHEQGSQLEDNFLQCDHVGWLFYRSMVDEKDQPSSAAIASELSRQMERYTDLICDGISEFGSKILTSDENIEASEDTKNGCKYRFKKEDDDGVAHDSYNFFVSCKPHSGEHLAPGKILVDGNNYWVVVSPSCDLVPGQKNAKSKTPNHMKFLAAKLHPKEKIEEARSEVASGNILFLTDAEGEMKPYSVYSMPPGGVGERYMKQRTWLAVNEGRIQMIDGQLVLTAYCEAESAESQDLCFEKVEFKVHDYQLRYEYALNLLSKVGGQSSRVGLDFKAQRE